MADEVCSPVRFPVHHNRSAPHKAGPLLSNSSAPATQCPALFFSPWRSIFEPFSEPQGSNLKMRAAVKTSKTHLFCLAAPHAVTGQCGRPVLQGARSSRLGLPAIKAGGATSCTAATPGLLLKLATLQVQTRWNAAAPGTS